MRIAHVIKATSIAGAETHLLTLTAGQQATGLSPHVVLLEAPNHPMDNYVTALQQHQVAVTRLKIRHNMDVTLVPRLRGVLRRLNPQIAHTHLFHADLYGTLAARLVGVPAIVTSRHNDNAFRRQAVYRRINHQLWQQVSAGIAISQSIARFVQEVEGAPSAKVHTIPYGLDFTPLTPAQSEQLRHTVRQELTIAEETPLAGITCRLVEQKGIPDGLAAFAKVRQQFPNAQLLIAGDGPLRAELEVTSAALGLGGAVRFLGWYADVPRLMSALDVLLVPSLWEGFGLVILEAMSRQLPVVATAVSAIPEIVVHGETGLLAPARDVDALAQATSTLLADRALRRHMGLLAEDRLETHFSAQRMIEDTITLYRTLL